MQTEGLKKGQRYLIQQINDGEIEAVHLLAGLLIKNKNVKGNISLAVEVLERGAELKDPKSSFLLGNFFSDGNYIEPDLERARYFYSLANQFGHPKAAKELEKIPLQPSTKKRDNENRGKGSEQSDKPKGSSKKQPPQVEKGYPMPPGYNLTQVSWDNDKINLNLVRITGSGFAISQDGLILTNEHVIDGCTEIFVVYQGKPKKARKLKADKKADFAALKINGSTPSYFFIKGDDPELGEELISGGFPSPENFGFGIKITTGIVSEEVSAQTSFFQHTTPSQPGNSGGPLLNSSGILVGISTAVSTVKWGDLSAQNVNYAVSNITAKKLLTKWGLPYKTVDNTLDFDSKTLSKHLKKSAAQVLCY